jgi:hypothetical protein
VVVCIRRVDEPVNVIFSGTSNGFFFCWRNHRGVSLGMTMTSASTYVPKVWEETFARQIDDPTDITGIAFDTSTNRLILCSSGGKEPWPGYRPKLALQPISSETAFSQNLTKTLEKILNLSHLNCLISIPMFISHYLVSIVPYS